MKNILIAIILTIFISTSAFAKKITIAIMDFQAKGVSKIIAENVSELIRGEMSNFEKLNILERKQMSMILKEQGFQQTGCTDVSCAVQAGRLLSARKILVGSVMKIGRTYIISGRIVDVEKGVSELSVKERCKSADDFDLTVEILTQKLAKKINTKEKKVSRLKKKKYRSKVSKGKSFGIGGYFNICYGGSTWENIKDKEPKFSKGNIKNFGIGGGLVMDTNLAKDKLFNYRLNVGYQKYTMGNEADLHKISLIQTFGFGLFRTKIIRLWLGPQFGLHSIIGEYSYYDLFYSFLLLKNKEKYLIGKADLGLALGINLNFGDLLTLAIDGGVKYGIGYGKVDMAGTMVQVSAGSVGVPSIGRAKCNPIEHGWEIYFNLAVLFRVK